jgi:hypothetical protein
MVRFFLIMALSLNVMAQTPSSMLQKNCIDCHLQQKIPSELIYRRYLMRYSTHKVIRKMLLSYLKAPSKETSIMPTQFFLKFPQKNELDLNESILLESIDAYLDYFNVKRRLILP